jgi:REP element-mobilizing transposase RayT
LDLFRKYISPIADLYAYCLLPNHFHLLLKIKDYEDLMNKNNSENIIKVQFGTFFGTYTKAINKIYHRTDSLFEGRFKRKLIKSNLHFYQTIAYIHQNPQKHRLVADYREWEHSSYWNYHQRDAGDLLKEELLSDKVLCDSIMSLHIDGICIEDNFKNAL